MHTIQIVLDEPLLEATDQAARRAKVNRSALVREALRAYLRRSEIRRKELQDRRGYEARPDAADDLAAWEEAAAWPDL